MSGPSASVGRADFVPAFGPLLERAGLANYESVMACRQGLRLDKPGLAGRERIRLRLDWPDGGPAELYLKRYKTNGPAIREWSALAEVRRAGVATMEPVGMGVGPAGGFVIVTAVPGEALSRCMGNLLERFSQDAGAMAELADGLGMLAGRLQAAGLAHRDFYTAHIFCDVCDPTGPAAKTPDRRFNLYLIDMARVFRPRWRKWRWRAKDLAGLKQSLDSAWVHRHWSGVIAAYERQLGRRLPLWVCWLIDIRSWAGHRRAIRRLAASQASRP